MSETPYLKLQLTPSSEWDTKKYGDFITELAGSDEASTLQKIDTAIKNVNDDLTSHEGDSISHITAEERELWNNRTPLVHASQHATGGSDPVTPAAIGAVAKSEKGVAGGIASLGSDGKVPSAQLPDLNYAPSTHASQHGASGSDPVTPAAIGAYPNGSKGAVNCNNLSDGAWTISASATNGPGAFACTLFHKDWNVDFASQIAFGADRNVYYRVKTGGSWLAWQEMYSTLRYPSPSKIGALAKSGDTMTGSLTISHSSYPDLDIKNTGSGSITKIRNSAHRTQIMSQEDTSNYRSLTLNDKSVTTDAGNILQIQQIDGGVQTASYNVYHTGYKPSPADIGAVAKSGDTMTGDLILARSGYPAINLRDTSNSSGGRFQHSNHATTLESRDTNTDSNRRYISIYDKTKQDDVKEALGLTDVVNDSYKTYTLLHSGNISDYNMDWVTVWPIPFTYNSLTVYTSPDTDESYKRKIIDLPEVIDCSAYYYDFRFTVYGLMKKGGTSISERLVTANLIHTVQTYDDGTTGYFGNELCGMQSSEAVSSMSSNLDFPGIYRMTIQTQPNSGKQCIFFEGSKGGVQKSFGEGVTINSSDVLGTNKFTKLEFKINVGSSPKPIQTYGIKFEYRKTYKKG